MALKLITPPTSEPVSLQEAKTHLRVDYSDQDIEISSLISAARSYCEQFQHRAYVSQQWQLVLDSFPDGRPPSSLYALYSHAPVSYRDFKDHIIIPLAPVISIDSVKYYLTDNTEMTMTPSTQYFVDNVSEPGRICLPYMVPWPMTVLRPENGVIINFTAGYSPVTACPFLPQLKAAILLMIGHLYEHREEVTSGAMLSNIPTGVEALLWPNRVF